jgi:hypothetical protein
MCTFINDYPGPINWRQTTQVSQTLVGNQNINIVFGMVDMRNFGHNTGDAEFINLWWHGKRDNALWICKRCV